jgi:hypothetical protein
MRRKNLFLSLSPNKRNYKVGIYEGSSIVIFGTVFIVAHKMQSFIVSSEIKRSITEEMGKSVCAQKFLDFYLSLDL